MAQLNDQQLAAIKRAIIKTQLIGIPAALLLGFGLYGVFVANGEAFHSLLNNRGVVYGMLVAGVVLEALQMYRLIPLLKAQARIVGARDS